MDGFECRLNALQRIFASVGHQRHVLGTPSLGLKSAQRGDGEYLPCHCIREVAAQGAAGLEPVAEEQKRAISEQTETRGRP